MPAKIVLARHRDVSGRCNPVELQLGFDTFVCEFRPTPARLVLGKVNSNLVDPNCTQAGTECVLFFAGDPPPQHEDVGICIVTETDRDLELDRELLRIFALMHPWRPARVVARRSPSR